MRTDEQKIAKQCIRDLLDAGYAVSVNDGEEVTVLNSRLAGTIFAALGTTDEDYLIAHKTDTLRRGVVQLVYGNEPGVLVADYSAHLEPVLARTEALAEKLSG